jgi:hypothetical protein
MINEKKVKGRHCGECKVCCTVMAVTEIEKPLRTDCKHLCEIGCGIYSERPESCQTFECMWLQGHIGNEDQRPEKLGVMFTWTKDNRLQAWEVWDKSFEDPKVKYMLNKIAGKTPIILKDFQQTIKLMGRRFQVERMMKR